MRTVTEEEFAEKIAEVLAADAEVAECGMVLGPGRSGAVAAVYASHLLHIPFIPYGQKWNPDLGRLLIIDTATESGATLRKATRKYGEANPVVIAIYQEPPRVQFWYESPKPQFYRKPYVVSQG